MSFKLRNTLFLLVLVIIFAVVGSYLVFVYYPGKIAGIETTLQGYEATINRIPERIEYLKQVRKIISERKDKIASFDKIVESNISIADAYGYIDKIQLRFGQLKFTMVSVKEVEAAGYGYRIFSLKGEGIFQSVLGLIWALEQGPRIFSIERMNLSVVESVRENPPPSLKNVPFIDVPFEIQVRAMYADVPDLPVRKESLGHLSLPKGENLFLPLISRDLPPNIDGGLEVEFSELRGLLPDKAIIADPAGKLHMLSVGDQVYLGYLTKIDQKNNLVEFALNKGGIVEKFVLELKFSGDK